MLKMTLLFLTVACLVGVIGKAAEAQSYPAGDVKRSGAMGVSTAFIIGFAICLFFDFVIFLG